MTSVAREFSERTNDIRTCVRGVLEIADSDVNRSGPSRCNPRADTSDNREYKRPANPPINNTGRDIYKQQRSMMASSTMTYFCVTRCRPFAFESTKDDERILSGNRIKMA